MISAQLTVEERDARRLAVIAQAPIGEPLDYDGSVVRAIPLTQGEVTIVDEADYDRVAGVKWRANWIRDTRSFRALRNLPQVGGKQRTVYMSRVLTGAGKGQSVDHANHDTLDNRRANLRVTDCRRNNQDRVKWSAASSGYKGVYWNKQCRKWRVGIRAGEIQANGARRRLYIGDFADEREAARSAVIGELLRSVAYACPNNVFTPSEIAVIVAEARAWKDPVVGQDPAEYARAFRAEVRRIVDGLL